MIIERVINIFRDVMYLENDDEIDITKSLFNEYEMSSIDLIDFSFELKKEFSLAIEPDDIWPINKMIAMAELYDAEKKIWTLKGMDALNNLILSGSPDVHLEPSVNVRTLYKFFTLEYVSGKIESWKKERPE